MPYKNPYCVLAALLLACAPLARAAESGLAQKQALLEQTADLLQQLSDQDYIDIKSQFEAKPGAGHLRASRAEAIASVYSTLAALEYNQALKTGPAPDARPNVEAALQTRLKEDDALMINPDTLEQTGLWGDFVEYVNRDPAPSYRGAAVAAVRGGREIDTEADKKAAKIKKSIKDLEPRLKQPGLAAPELAALHYEKGRLYENLSRCGLGLDGMDQKQARILLIADLLEQVSDEDYLKVKAELEAKNPGSRWPASRGEARSAAYSTLAALEYDQALKAGPATEDKPNLKAALQNRLKDANAVMVNPDTLEETGLWGDFVEYVNRDPAPSYRGAAVAAVRGGREIDTEADKKAAKIKRSLKDLEPRLKQPGLAAPELAALHYEKGRLYEILAESAVIEKPQAPEAPKTAQPPVQTAEDAVKCETKEMDSLEKRMQDEVERRRARVK